MKKRIIFSALLFFIVFAALIWNFLLKRPDSFPASSVVTIEKGLNLSSIAGKLEGSGIIHSELGFKILAKVLNKSRKIRSGEYLFEKPLSVLAVLTRLTKGDFGFGAVKIVVPEGFSNKNISELFADFKNFDKEEFLAIAKDSEGYLFPDTYLFLPSANADQVIKTMRDNFSKKTGEVEQNVVIMASLIEKEVPETEDRKVVSGILWKRLEIGMPLQVDAVFPYITGRKDVTLDDYKIESIYNTYLNKGLPPGPISNPGLDAIEAAQNPKQSPYLYYLSGKDGKTRFARTYEEHLRNKEKYLR
ncbi:endolytic transglycosylase MltG [Candidatus Parcubacteria bacterium]|nr:MAG: endolytic transglycosylase MltG [Candidatus Parcubacteria bacterium]